MNLLLLFACSHAPPDSAGSAALSPSAQVWTLRAAEASTTPPQIHELLDQYFDVRLLLQSTGGEQLSLVFAPTADGATQDRCAPTTPWAPAPLAQDGAFTAAGPTLALRTDKLRFQFDDVKVTGRLSSDGLTVSEVTGVLDTRPLAPLLDEHTPLAICNTLGRVLPCEPCADGEAACWSIGLSALTLQPVDAAIEPRDDAQINADPSCQGP